MPRGDFNIYLASSRRGYVRAEEYVHFFHAGIKGGGMLYIFNAAIDLLYVRVTDECKN